MGAEKAWMDRRMEYGPSGHSPNAYGHGVMAGDGLLYGGRKLSKSELKKALRM
jgi:hypothetical protein